jgi:hypothetical protein
LQIFFAKAQENEDVRNEQNVYSVNKLQFIRKYFSHLDRMNNDKRRKFALLSKPRDKLWKRISNLWLQIGTGLLLIQQGSTKI